MSSFVLKVIAVCSMLFDHINSHLSPVSAFADISGLSYDAVEPVWRFFAPFGRLAFPIFAFLIAEGCRRTKNPQRYVARLLVFALVSELPFGWMADNRIALVFNTSNVFFTLALGAVACLVYRNVKDGGHPVLALLPPLGFTAVGALARTDYGGLGVALIFAAYVFENKALRTAGMAAVLSWLYLVSAGLMQHPDWLHTFGVWASWAGAMLALVLLLCYNGSRGRRAKWFFYVFYPAHITAIVLLRVLTVA